MLGLVMPCVASHMRLRNAFGVLCYSIFSLWCGVVWCAAMCLTVSSGPTAGAGGKLLGGKLLASCTQLFAGGE